MRLRAAIFEESAAAVAEATRSQTKGNKVVYIASVKE